MGRGFTVALAATAAAALLLVSLPMLLVLPPDADTYEQENRRMFLEWKANHKKRSAYKSAGEEECRYAVFKETRCRVAWARAARGDTSSGLNGFAATTIEEFNRMLMFRRDGEYEQETRRVFVGWKDKYGKTYRDAGEEECRYMLFKGNRRIVVRLNADATARATSRARHQSIRRPHQRGGPRKLLPGDGGPRAERQVPSRRPRPGPQPW